MRVILKCGEIYKYHIISKVLINDTKILITGNFRSGQRYKTNEFYIETIENYKDFRKYLQEYKTEYEHKGACPYCNSLRVIKKYTAVVEKKLKPKAKLVVANKVFSHYYCFICSETFEELEPTEAVSFY